MPKIVDYPRASLLNSIELADAVSSLGGSSTALMAAERLNRKEGGAFTALISAATKYGLISSKGGRLAVQQVYRDYKLAYNDVEKRNALRAALLSPPMFLAIYKRFEGKPLPVEHFGKLLIREFDVPQDQASKVSAYFLEGADQAGIIEAGNVLATMTSSSDLAEPESSSADDDESQVAVSPNPVAAKVEPLGPTDYAITFKGPGLNSTIVVAEEEDLLIVEAMLKKVKKVLVQRLDEQ
ncbi:hypothetical protein [Rhodanobacter thiooxydans]|uniref:hypothetical protein n=1 Tax=Rhodanobacter thiooxydans TaxID=416169 RepID=UPI00131EE3F9|nr:hypothetical protein [Rhodanobacter thiooxydans]